MTRDATTLHRLVRRALADLDLEGRTTRALLGLRRPEALRVVAVGKAAAAMTRGALAAWGDSLERALVIVPRGAPAGDLRDRPRIAVHHSDHPVPSAASVRAAKHAVALVSAPLRTPDTRTLILVSGGASALMCLPSAGVSLRTKAAVTRELLRTGASIQSVNVVRKHLSRIKGGGLLRAARSPVLTLVGSDVIGGRPSDVGSGPSVPDVSTVAEARAILRRHAPAFAALPLAATDRSGVRGRVRMLASPEELAHHTRDVLRDAGMDARVLPRSQAPVASLASRYRRLAHELGAGEALVRAAEPSLVVPTDAGEGGRATHLAALVARRLPADVVFLAMATDGVDGVSLTAGAVVDGTFAARAGEADLARAIADFDAGPLHRRFGTALPAALTGHNLTDIHVLWRPPRRR